MPASVTDRSAACAAPVLPVTPADWVTTVLEHGYCRMEANATHFHITVRDGAGPAERMAFIPLSCEAAWH